ITTGVSATTFEPNTLLNREQAATMLTRTFKRATMNGWTIQNDAQFALTYDKPSAFADDKDISDWAKDSVYFMAANNIINGVGDNKFAPKNITSEEEATGYANATREQALIIAVRMVENLK
ncbi:MAG: S-layer homology domain-containing protein, partial [Ruminococcaceae bacterium]|nr:S-layer homology domain-containing protein [Oscillospiraceae bacterium]